MKILIFGASGFVGSAVARKLKVHGHDVSGIARDDAAADRLHALGIAPVPGDYDDLAGLAAAQAGFDGFVFAPTISFDAERPTLEALLAPLAGSGKPFVFTSGTAVLSIEAHDGSWHEETFTEEDAFTPPEWLAMRVETENFVRAAADRGVRAMVVRPPLIWGHGGSRQIPGIFASVRSQGAACYIGRGLNLYSHVHVDDLAEVYRLAIEKGQAGALYHAVAGEACFRAMAEAVAQVVGVPAKSVGIDEARAIWGDFVGPLYFGVSSRSRALVTRRDLGWKPEHVDVIEDIRSGSYQQAFAAGKL